MLRLLCTHMLTMMNIMMSIMMTTMMITMDGGTTMTTMMITMDGATMMTTTDGATMMTTKDGATTGIMMIITEIGVMITIMTTTGIITTTTDQLMKPMTSIPKLELFMETSTMNHGAITVMLTMEMLIMVMPLPGATTVITVLMENGVMGMPTTETGATSVIMENGAMILDTMGMIMEISVLITVMFTTETGATSVTMELTEHGDMTDTTDMMVLDIFMETWATTNGDTVMPTTETGAISVTMTLTTLDLDITPSTFISELTS